MPAFDYKLPVTPKIEDVACQLMEKQFQMLLKTIDKLLATARWPFEVLCSLIQQFKQFLQNVFQDLMNEIDASVRNFVDFAFGPLNQLKDDSCMMAYKCKAFMDNMTNPKKSPLYLTGICSKKQLEGIASKYEMFSNFVCYGPGLGEGLKQLASMINQFLEDVLTFCTDKLDKLLSKILEAKEKFKELLKKLGVFELLDQLEAFTSCALGVCDFTYSAANAVEDYKARYYLVKTGDGWEFNMDIMDELEADKDSMAGQMSETLKSYPKW